MTYSHEVEMMCPVAQGVNHGAAPIPEEAKWVKAKEIKDISALGMLKEIEGNIIIRNSYTGGTLIGLDNITKIGGLSIGSEENLAANETLEMVSMTKLNEVTGNIHVYNNGVKIVQFDLLKAIEGDFVISSSSIPAEQCMTPRLTGVTGYTISPGSTRHGIPVRFMQQRKRTANGLLSLPFRRRTSERSRRSSPSISARHVTVKKPRTQYGE